MPVVRRDVVVDVIAQVGPDREARVEVAEAVAAGERARAHEPQVRRQQVGEVGFGLLEARDYFQATSSFGQRVGQLFKSRLHQHGVDHHIPPAADAQVGARGVHQLGAEPRHAVASQLFAPQLDVELTADTLQPVVGGQMTLRIRLRNVGTGRATGVEVEQ